MIVVPADVGVDLRGALYVGLARVAGDINDECSLAEPGDLPSVLAQFDRIRGLLDHIGWDKKQQPHDLQVDVVHRQLLIETLADDQEGLEWLSRQEATESPEGRKRAAARAATIGCFLAELGDT